MSDRPGLVQGQVCWHELACRDREKERSFYQELLGWQTEDHEMPGEMGGTYTMLRLDGDDLGGLYEMHGEMFEGVPSHWDLYFYVGNVDEIVARATELGASPLVPPMDVPGVGRIAMMNDPTGAGFAVFAPGEHPGARPATRHGAFTWDELTTRDAAAAISFYTELLGLEAETSQMEHGEYTVLKAGETMLGGIMQMTDEWGDLPSHWMVYVAVDDCDATADQAKALGGTVCVAPTDIPQVGRFAVLNDPDGAVFSIITLDQESCQ
jgi:predicted enzyme related to lactoylglutathione lyase